MMTMSLMIMTTVRVVAIAPLFSMKSLLTGLSASFSFFFYYHTLVAVVGFFAFEPQC